MNNTPKSVSSIFEEAMKSKGVSVEKLADKTNISERFIRLILEENFDELPPAPYLHGYVVKISDALDLDGQQIWESYFKSKDSVKRSGALDTLPENRFAISRLNKKALTGILVPLLIIGYFVFQAIFAFNVSDEITISNLDEDTTVVQNPEFRVEGNVGSDYELLVNQERVYPDASGNFEKVINLNPGLNTVTFNIEGVLGKKGQVVRQILYQTTTTQPETTTESPESDLPASTP